MRPCGVPIASLAVSIVLGAAFLSVAPASGLAEDDTATPTPTLFSEIGEAVFATPEPSATPTGASDVLGSVDLPGAGSRAGGQQSQTTVLLIAGLSVLGAGLAGAAAWRMRQRRASRPD